jgi:arylsulfatase A-like enzyme
VADPTVERAYSYLLSTIDSAEAPDLVLLYDENTMTMKPAFLQMGRKGDHGGATWGSQHIGLFLSGPGIKRGYASNFPARLVDLAPTVEELMGIRPRSQDGVPLADAMIHPASWALTQEKAVRPRLLQYVASLTREARLRPNTR